MQQQDYTALTDYLSLIMADKAQLAQLAHREPILFELCRDWVAFVEGNRPKPTAGPFPASAELTAVQAAIFDNWPCGKRVKGRPNRYGMAIEFWTSTKIQTSQRNNWQRKANTAMMGADDLQRWLRKTLRENAGRKNPLSEAYLAKLVQLSTEMGDDEYIGLLVDKTSAEGTVYYDFQYVYASIKDNAAWAVLSLHDASMPLPAFVTTQADGEPLNRSRGVILQSRADLSGFSTKWATDGEAA